MPKTIITTDKAPAAIGPYSQATKLGNLMFCSGQIPLDPATGKLVEGDVGVQTKRVMDNLKAVVEAGGYTMADILKTTILLADLADYPKVNEIYASYFTGEFPARAAFQVAKLPLACTVEIEAVVGR
jgi:2-iminobutanoate/2-iminopropanoate deaminase